jgi:hypothetical protein
VPDVLVIFRKKPIFVELKSRQGLCSPSQRTERETILRAGAQWWFAPSANAVMWALPRPGARFRTRTCEDGTTERWRQPRLAPWRCRAVIRLSRAPTRRTWWQRRAARQRWLSRQQCRENGQLLTKIKLNGERTDGTRPKLVSSETTLSDLAMND